MMISKADIRKELLDKRLEMDSISATAASEIICDNILVSNEYKACKYIYGYYPVKNEVNIIPVIEKAFVDGKTVLMPRCTEEKGIMNFHVISSLSDLKPGKYGIMEPDSEADIIEAEEGMVLVPGVAFDPDGRRIGYGGGYYDRYLCKYPGLYRMAVAYRIQFTFMPFFDKNDQMMDQIITEIDNLSYKRQVNI